MLIKVSDSESKHSRVKHIFLAFMKVKPTTDTVFSVFCSSDLNQSNSYIISNSSAVPSNELAVLTRMVLEISRICRSKILTASYHEICFVDRKLATNQSVQFATFSGVCSTVVLS